MEEKMFVRNADEIAKDEMRVYPASQFEINALDANRVLLKIHFFASPEAHEKGETESQNFLIPVAGIARLANHLNLVLKELRAEASKRKQ
jgi:hypothetical protein